MRLSEIYLNTHVVRDVEFSRLGYVDSACDRLLAYADALKYALKAVKNPHLVALITTPELAEAASAVPGLMIADSPRDVFYGIHQIFMDTARYKLPFKPSIGRNCRIHPSAFVSPKCCIGDNVVIAEQAVITEGAWIGSNVKIGPGAKIGVDGILYTRGAERMIPIGHAGYVRIGDHVTMMTNSVAVRSIHDTDVTEIGEGSLIGLGAIVGHEAKIGKGVVVSNQCVVARRSVIGDHAFLGTHTVVKESLRIGSGAKLMAGSIVIDHVTDEAAVSGNFAEDHKGRMLNFLRNIRGQGAKHQDRK